MDRTWLILCSVVVLMPHSLRMYALKVNFLSPLWFCKFMFISVFVAIECPFRFVEFVRLVPVSLLCCIPFPLFFFFAERIRWMNEQSEMKMAKLKSDNFTRNWCALYMCLHAVNRFCSILSLAIGTPQHEQLLRPNESRKGDKTIALLGSKICWVNK